MRRFTCLSALLVYAACITLPAFAGEDQVLTSEYVPSMAPGALEIGVTHTLWIPEGVKQLRGIIVHQHGCGEGACKGGATAAYDLHWQALARKWDCALLGPSYHQAEAQNCRLWCDPRNGSRTVFLNALDQFAQRSGHPELASVPWCLWGHSGGGYWASLMQASDPDRIVAIWCRSGTAFSTWEKGEIPKPELPESVYHVPVMCNPGEKEQYGRFAGAWTGAQAMFAAYRQHGAPIGLAPDPLTSHECGDSRYLAIPFFDACLAMRLPDAGSQSQQLKPVDWSQAWFAEPLTSVAVPAVDYPGDKLTAVWLPNAAVAKAWMEYVKVGSTSDATPPSAPRHVITAAKSASQTSGAGTLITWKAAADFESGLQKFLILRDGQMIGSLPEKPVGKFGRPLFQAMSYHDTPEAPLPVFQFLDTTPGNSATAKYQVISVNSVGLQSAASE